MKFKVKLLLLVALVISLGTMLETVGARHQSGATYQQMPQAERAAFVSEQARRLALQMSAREYKFTPAFEAAIQRSVDMYVQRIGNNRGDQPGRGDARVIFERGQAQAPALIRIFKAQDISPLIGLYLPAIESEYVNIQTPNAAGALGMFQFLPATGEHFGLTANDLLDVPKSADAAARYIAAGIKKFNDDPMKEALALLAYNRGADHVERDLAALVTAEKRACSICALSEQASKLDATFQHENVYYVPRFFAVAILGENPQSFGLQTAPLSSF